MFLEPNSDRASSRGLILLKVKINSLNKFQLTILKSQTFYNGRCWTIRGKGLTNAVQSYSSSKTIPKKAHHYKYPCVMFGPGNLRYNKDSLYTGKFTCFTMDDLFEKAIRYTEGNIQYFVKIMIVTTAVFLSSFVNCLLVDTPARLASISNLKVDTQRLSYFS